MRQNMLSYMLVHKHFSFHFFFTYASRPSFGHEVTLFFMNHNDFHDPTLSLILRINVGLMTFIPMSSWNDIFLTEPSTTLNIPDLHSLLHLSWRQCRITCKCYTMCPSWQQSKELRLSMFRKSMPFRIQIVHSIPSAGISWRLSTNLHLHETCFWMLPPCAFYPFTPPARIIREDILSPLVTNIRRTQFRWSWKLCIVCPFNPTTRNYNRTKCPVLANFRVAFRGKPRMITIRSPDYHIRMTIFKPNNSNLTI